MMASSVQPAASDRPTCEPLTSLEEIMTWAPPPTDAAVPLLPKRRLPRKHEGRQWLVCHDMAGGYLEDRFVQGVLTTDCYRYYHWGQIDTFVYFSHHFITIPPPAWTTAAVENGVRILGTVITEWDDGKLRCQEFLKSRQSAETLAYKLTDIACHYHFNGWLVNIENEVEEQQVSVLVHFLRVLSREMRQRDPDSLVLWYDSVITSGELKWQNELNDLNYEFFEACDGIFLNYTWKESNLENSVLKATENFKQRLTDVYVGIDVFGRGCCGGGGFNTSEAVNAMHPHGLSIALFAQGWVFETQDKQQFICNNNKFWGLIEDRVKPRMFDGEYFVSSFCQGWGKKYFSEGKLVTTGAWTNLALQNAQPTTYPSWSDSTSGDSEQDGLASSYHLEDAYRGGGSLKISGVVNKSAEYVLFASHVTVHHHGSIVISITYKHLRTAQGKFAIGLVTSSLGNSLINSTYVLLPPGEENWPVSEDAKCITACTEDEARGLRHKLLLSSPHPDSSWQSRVYILNGEDSNIEKTSIMFTHPERHNVSMLIGEFKILSNIGLDTSCSDMTAADLSVLAVTDVTSSCVDDKRTVSCVLHWKLSSSLSDLIRHFSVYICVESSSDKTENEPALLGHTGAREFHTGTLQLPFNTTAVLFIVKLMLITGVTYKNTIKSARIPL